MRRLVWLAALLTGCRAPIAPPGPLAEPSPAPPVAAPESPVALPELRQLGLTGLDGGPREVTVAVAEPARFTLRVWAASDVTGWRTAEQVARETGAAAVLNGGYFDRENRPLGLLISDGRAINPRPAGDGPVLLVDDGGRLQLIDRARWPGGEGVRQALQCSPRLVRDGRPTRLKESTEHRRSAVGLDAAGRIILAATTGGGLTLAAFAEILARPLDAGGAGCVEALNLDGGPSSQFVVPGRVRLSGAYPMPSHLVLQSVAE